MKRLSAMFVSLTIISTFACDQQLIRDRKYSNLYDWMGTVVTNPFVIDDSKFCPAYTGKENFYECRKDCCNGYNHYIPMLALYPDQSIKTVWSLNTSIEKNVVEGDVFERLFQYPNVGMACSYILTNSLMFIPSDNTVYGLLVPSKVQSNEDSYLQRIRCKIQDDGSIRQHDLRKVDDSTCEKLTKGIGTNWAFSCATDQCKKRFSIMLWQENEQNNKFKLLTGDTTEKSFTYSSDLTMDKIWWIYTKKFFDPCCLQRLQVNDKKKSFFLDYNLEPQNNAIYCYEHEIAVDVNKPHIQKTISLNRTWTSVRDHILAWPVIHAGESHDAIKPPAKRLIHCYQDDTAWPQEIFSDYFAHIWHITQIQKDGTYDDADTKYVNECEISKLAKLVQIMFVSKLSYVNTYCWAIQDRSLSKRSPHATLAINADGELYYCSKDGQKYVDNVGQPGQQYPFALAVPKIWAAKIGFPNGGENDLMKNRSKALQLSAQDFFKFYTDRAMDYTQRTWDNGTIGVYWYFDKGGMHIRLYDLTKEQPENIDNYVEHRNEGVISSVEYTPGHRPIFHIN